MSKAYELIMDSLNEIITDLEETGGKNLKRETLSVEISTPKQIKIENNNKTFVRMKPARGRLKKFLR